VAVLAVLTVAFAIWAWGGSDSGDDDGDARDRMSATTEASPTAPTTTLRPGTEDEPLRILVAGDSLMGWIAPALEDELADAPVEVIDDWKGSTGLARPDYFDWPARLAEDVATHDPDVVIVGFGGNDTQPLTTPGGVITRDDPAWQVEYQRRVAEVLDAVEGPGRTLWWVGLPLTERDNIEALRPAIAGAVRAELADRPWTRFVDSLQVLAPDGTYQVTLPGPDGEPVRVRADDGVHPSPGGGRMLVASFVDDLRDERGLSPAG